MSILLSILFIPLQIILTIIVSRLDIIQGDAWMLWFARPRGKAAKFFTRAFLLVWVASPLFAGIMSLTLSKSTPEAYVLTMKIITILLSIFASGCVFYLAAWATCRKD